MPMWGYGWSGPWGGFGWLVPFVGLTVMVAVMITCFRMMVRQTDPAASDIEDLRREIENFLTGYRLTLIFDW